MKRLLYACAALSIALLTPMRGSDESLNEAMRKLNDSYATKIQAAAQELSSTRERIQKEQAPLVAKITALETEIIALESEITRSETAKEKRASLRKAALKDGDAYHKSFAYFASSGSDHLKNVELALLPGEADAETALLAKLGQQCDVAAKANDASGPLAVVDHSLQRITRSIGGYQAEGIAVLGQNTEIVKGTFLFVGPDAFFLDTAATTVGVARHREGAPLPVVHALPEWKAEDARGLLTGKSGLLMADATGGKALHLQQTSGSLSTHIQKGGIVAYAIIGIGVLSLILGALKMFDLRRLVVDAPRTFEPVLRAFQTGENEALKTALANLRGHSRELATLAVECRDFPKEALEDQLEAYVSRQRLHFESRLPLLAVIATASPLMGLLGTVMGMVRTFTLITVFGTGNAGKLSSGISEVLVTTELGLAVAIPTLVMHGILTHRIQKKLGLLERYAFEFSLARHPETPTGTETHP